MLFHRTFTRYWGDRFDTSIDEILTVESTIARRITVALRQVHRDR